nr:hypothetical protein [Tanacetum cinerariifolium]
MSTLAEFMIVAGAKNGPPMLDNTMYNSWHSRMLLYLKGKKNGRMMLESIENGPLSYPTIEENGAIRPKKYVELSEQDKLQDDCDVQALNTVLQGLPPDVYALVNHCQVAKEIQDRVKLLMQGTELSYQERKCKLYNEFDKFTSIKGESLHEYHLHFVQVNTKFLNALQLEWSKFVTDVKLEKNMYTTNFDQLYAYLSQHEGHANKVRMVHERYPDPLALVVNHQTQSNYVHYLQQLSSIHQKTHSSQPLLLTYEAPRHPQQYQHAYQPQISHPTPSVPKNAYHFSLISQQPPAQEAGQELDEEHLAFLADPRIPYGQAIQITIPRNVTFRTDDLDTYDSDNDDISSAKAVLMAKLLSYDSNVLFEDEVPEFVIKFLNMIQVRINATVKKMELNFSGSCTNHVDILECSVISLVDPPKGNLVSRVQLAAADEMEAKRC